jgi:hypothetical protein
MDPRAGTICAGDSFRIRAAVMRIIKEARDSAELEQRRSIRVPFFRPVLVGLNDGDPPRFSAFCRDLSIYGIGLLHIMPLHCREVLVRFASRVGEPTDLHVRMDWCQDCGEGWYMSGGRLLDVE